MGLYSTVCGISWWWSVTIKSSPLFYFAPGMEQYTLVYSQNGISYNIPKQAFAYYSNSMATQALLSSSDVVKNPGPSQEKVARTNNLSGSKPTAAKSDHFQKTIRWNQKNISCAVSVKMVGTLWGLLVPSMLVYKIWWPNRNKQLWEGRGEHERGKNSV